MPPSTVAAEDSGGSEHVRETYKQSTRVRQPSTGSARSHPSSRGSHRIESYSSSGTASSYEVIDEDEIEPSDSASRSRAHTSARYIEERPPPPRRHSSHRRERVPAPEVEERRPRRHSSRRHHSSRPRRLESQRPPSDESYSDTVASHHDDYPDSRYGRAYPPPPGFRHGHGGYPPSIVPSAPGYPPGYGSRQALMQIPQQHDEFGYPVNDNPFTPQDPRANPFSPMSNASGPGYFGMDPHAPPMRAPRPPGPPRPQSYAAPSHYGSELMSPYGHPGMPPYHGYGMPPMPGYPPMPGWYPPPSTHSSPAPPDSKDDGKSKEYEAISALLQKTEEARLAWQKEMVAKAEADAAAKAKEEEEKKKKEEIANASKAAKEAAEKKAEADLKKAKDEHETKLKEAEKAREDAEKKQKDLEKETERLKPPEHAGKSIRFKDALDRKFSFPFHLCKTWKGMETLIKQAFMQIDDIGDHVRQGHYDLTGPDGEIILPQVWENMVQPDWEIEMHMWPLPEKEKKKGKHAVDPSVDPLAALGLGPLADLGIGDPGKKKSTKKDGTKKKAGKSADAHVVNVGPSMGLPPPPPGYNPGMLPDPFAMAGMPPFPAMEAPKDGKPKKSNSKSSKGNNASGLAAWFAGSSGPRPSKKDNEKLDLVRHKSGHSVSGSSTRHSRRSSRHSGSLHSSSHSSHGNAERVVGCAVM